MIIDVPHGASLFYFGFVGLRAIETERQLMMDGLKYAIAVWLIAT